MNTLPLALSAGDPCGIGPEIVLKCFADPAFDRKAVVVGDAGLLQREIESMELPLQLRPVALDPDGFVVQAPGSEALQPIDAAPLHAALRAACDGAPGVVPVLPVSALPTHLPHGRVDGRAGRSAHDAVRAAAALAFHGAAAAVVTAPLHKEALSAAGVVHPGHTELLAALAGLAPTDVAMMLANDELRTLLVSIHVPLAQAISLVTRDNVLRAIRQAHAALRHAGLSAPRIAVAGLNPHAGEGGLFGHEDVREIVPAVEAARAEGIDASGPWPGDTVFGRARNFREFDLVVAMYHDQGLIPVKYLGIDTGVNVTVGLPFVRTSVDHGTAFDIAGRGAADHRSLLAAMRMARAMAG